MRWKMAVLVVALACRGGDAGGDDEVAGRAGESLVAHVTWQAEVRAEYGGEYEPSRTSRFASSAYRETGGVHVPST